MLVALRMQTLIKGLVHVVSRKKSYVRKGAAAFSAPTSSPSSLNLPGMQRRGDMHLVKKTSLIVSSPNPPQPSRYTWPQLHTTATTLYPDDGKVDFRSLFSTQASRNHLQIGDVSTTQLSKVFEGAHSTAGAGEKRGLDYGEQRRKRHMGIALLELDISSSVFWAPVHRCTCLP